MRQRIVIPRGDTALVSFNVTGRTPLEDDRVVLSVRRPSGGLMLEMISPVEEGKPVQFFFSHEDTERMREGEYAWDVRYVTEVVKDEEGRVIGGEEVATFYRDSPFEIVKVVTKL